MNFKFLSLLSACLVGSSTLAGCAVNDSEVVEYTIEIESAAADKSTQNSNKVEIDDDTHELASDYFWDESKIIAIELDGEKIDADDEDGEVKIDEDDGEIKIKSAGIYRISGTLDDGQIVVDAEDDEVVQLILDGAEINCSHDSAILVKNAEKVVIILTENSSNSVSDGSNYELDEDDEENAAIFSKSDLTIFGESGGSLSVRGNFNDGIASKDGLVIRSATLEVTAVDDGVRGKDYLFVAESEIAVDADGDGLKSDDAAGHISIKKSELAIVAGGDGFDAKTNVEIVESTLAIVAGGGSANKVDAEISKKGIKAAGNISLDGGEISIDSADDALHANGEISVDVDTLEISSGDDGIHADSKIEINGGAISILKSYEGIESSIITINGGDISITASDDGLNVAGGNDGSAMGRPGAGGFAALEGAFLYLNGGSIKMNSGGDGLDSNGSIVMTGGEIFVDGPTNDGNGAIDCNGTFEISGGYLVAVGSSGMAESPDSEDSTQFSILVNFDAKQTAGTTVKLVDESGAEVFAFEPAKQFQSVVFSSNELESGAEYSIYLEDELVETFALDAITTKIGATGGMGGGMGGGRGGRNSDSTTTDDSTREEMDFGDREMPESKMEGGPDGGMTNLPHALSSELR